MSATFRQPNNRNSLRGKRAGLFGARGNLAGYQPAMRMRKHAEQADAAGVLS